MRHKHHIVFKSQGGLDFELNYKYLTLEGHEGDNGPHRNRATDLMYKLELQGQLEALFEEGGLYSEEDVARKLGRSAAYWHKHLAKVRHQGGMMAGGDIIRRLMGGKVY